MEKFKIAKNLLLAPLYLVAFIVVRAKNLVMGVIMAVGSICAADMVFRMLELWHDCGRKGGWTAAEEFQHLWWLAGSNSSVVFYKLMTIGLVSPVFCAYEAAKKVVDCSELKLSKPVCCFAWVLTILIAALRILVVDEHFFNESRSYGVFPVPSACPNSSSANSTESWIGLDGLEYCSDKGNFSEVAFSEGAPYYIATARTSYDQSCSSFTIDSAVLDLWDCEERLGGVACAAINSFGTEECTRFSWVLGGKLGLLLEWVSALKVLTDSLFLCAVCTASSKKSVTTWTIVLVSFELYQLAILLPATVFYHGECLHVTSPSYVSLHTIQDGVLALAAATQFALEFPLLLFILYLGVPICYAGLLLLISIICCSLAAVGLDEPVFDEALSALLRMGGYCWIACMICTFVTWSVGVILVLAAAIPFGCIALFLLLIPGSEAGWIGLVLASNLVVKFPLVGAAALLWNYAPEDWKDLQVVSSTEGNDMSTAGPTGSDYQSVPAPVQIGWQESI